MPGEKVLLVDDIVRTGKASRSCARRWNPKARKLSAWRWPCTSPILQLLNSASFRSSTWRKWTPCTTKTLLPASYAVRVFLLPRFGPSFHLGFSAEGFLPRERVRRAYILFDRSPGTCMRTLVLSAMLIIASLPCLPDTRARGLNMLAAHAPIFPLTTLETLK